MQEQPYINVSGPTIHCNKTGTTFEINASQYTTHYKTSRTNSILPICGHFNSNKYRNKKPVPSDNTYVSIEGFLDNVELDPMGHASVFHIAVDNINFLRKAAVSSIKNTNITTSCSSRSHF